MADALGLADLGLRAVKRAVKHGSAISERHRDIDALVAALAHAHDVLISAKASRDEYQVHEDILAPLIEETVLFLEAVGARKRFKFLAGKYLQPGRDSLVARRLLETLKAAPLQIQARTFEVRLLKSQSHVQTIPQVLNDMAERQRTSLSRMTHSIVLCNLFFRNGSAYISREVNQTCMDVHVGRSNDLYKTVGQGHAHG